MPSDENSLFSWRLSEWFPDLDKTKLLVLRSYCEFLLKSNKALSLISPKTIPVIDAVHFSDCIVASKIIYDDATGMNEIYDLGSGQGFPGIIFAILYPHIKVNLIESDVRKAEFLTQAISFLSLNNVQAVFKSIESLEANSIKWAVSRGLANLSKSILIGRKCFAKGGVYYHMKSEQWSLELSEIPIQLCSIWTPALVKEYKIPVAPVKFSIVKTTKT